MKCRVERLLDTVLLVRRRERELATNCEEWLTMRYRRKRRGH